MGFVSTGYGAASDDDPAIRREALILQHLSQVRLIAKRIHDRLPDHVALDDLVSTGVIGLLAAIDNFDQSLNVQLRTYAEQRIRGAIMDSLREMDWAPRDTRKKSRTIEEAIRRAGQRLGREPVEEEIATELRISPNEYQQWLTDVQAIDLQPLEHVSADGQEVDLLNLISDDEANWPSRIVERSELQRVLTLAIERMPKVERTVLSLYYFEDLNLRETAQIMGLHLSRVGQLRTQAILRLRGHLERVWLSSPKKRQ